MEKKQYQIQNYLLHLNTVEQACIEQKDEDRLADVLDSRALVLAALFTGHDLMEIEMINGTHGQPTFIKSGQVGVKATKAERPRLSVVKNEN